jgi:pimeloyl-ACP methyl ester carboxylesterase
MARVVFVHGIGHQYRSRALTKARWFQALAQGLDDSNLPPLPESDVDLVHYGNCFRLVGAKGLDDEWIPPLGPGDLESAFELEFLTEIADGLEADGRSNLPTKVYVPEFAQALVRKLQASEFLPDAAQRKIVWFVRQVHRYLTEDDLRARIQERLDETVTSRTRVLVGHSMGSLVAYEGLMAHPEWEIDTFVTLGSPLGLRVLGPMLQPPANGSGKRPAVRRWVNVAAKEDGVAAVKELSPIFGDIEDVAVTNGRRHAHDIARYLTTDEACKAISRGLG